MTHTEERPVRIRGGCSPRYRESPQQNLAMPTPDAAFLTSITVGKEMFKVCVCACVFCLCASLCVCLYKEAWYIGQRLMEGIFFNALHVCF